MDIYRITEEINSIAASLHEDLRNYSNMRDIDKPIIVSACLLTVKYKEEGLFDFGVLNGDTDKTDGEKMYNLLKRELSKLNLNEDYVKTMMECYSCLKNIESINKIHSKLGITPLKGFLICIENNLVKFCKNNNLTDDYLGIFYSQFMSYSGADGQSLGIILTPTFITDLFTSLIDLKPTDIILDPCYGTGGFLISSLIDLSKKGVSETDICKNNLYGYDIQPHMFTITMTNLILRGCETQHISYKNFMEESSEEIYKNIGATVGFMNPPYAQGKKDIALSEINFVKHLLDSLKEGAKCIVIVPASTFVDSNKTNDIKFDIYENHTLEGVITLNEDTFYGVGTMPIIAVFTAHKPHPKDKICKFIDYKDDGYISQPHVGRIHTPMSDVQKEHLLKVWNDETDADKNFCIKTTVKKDDEWLYNFYHSNLDIPKKKVFEEKISKYLSFFFSMTIDGKYDLFKDEIESAKYRDIETLQGKKWKVFQLGEDFVVDGAKVTNDKYIVPGDEIPRVTTSMLNNAYEGFYSGTLSNGKKATINKGKVITIETASKGATFYQPSDFIANTHVMTITLKNKTLNQYVGLFIASCITNAINNKYYYGYKFSKFRILKEKIILPITSEGNIDYEYMEQYMKNIISNKLLLFDSYRM